MTKKTESAIVSKNEEIIDSPESKALAKGYFDASQEQLRNRLNNLLLKSMRRDMWYSDELGNFSIELLTAKNPKTQSSEIVFLHHVGVVNNLFEMRLGLQQKPSESPVWTVKIERYGESDEISLNGFKIGDVTIDKIVKTKRIMRDIQTIFVTIDGDKLIAVRKVKPSDKLAAHYITTTVFDKLLPVITTQVVRFMKRVEKDVKGNKERIAYRGLTFDSQTQTWVKIHENSVVYLTSYGKYVLDTGNRDKLMKDTQFEELKQVHAVITLMQNPS